MKQSSKANVHDVIQLIPEHEWSGQLAYVTEVTETGIIVLMQTPERQPIFMTLTESEYEVVGAAPFIFHQMVESETIEDDL